MHPTEMGRMAEMTNEGPTLKQVLFRLDEAISLVEDRLNVGRSEGSDKERSSPIVAMINHAEEMCRRMENINSELRPLN